jgi:hypothetical protein
MIFGLILGVIVNNCLANSDTTYYTNGNIKSISYGDSGYVYTRYSLRSDKSGSETFAYSSTTSKILNSSTITLPSNIFIYCYYSKSKRYSSSETIYGMADGNPVYINGISLGEYSPLVITGDHFMINLLKNIDAYSFRNIASDDIEGNKHINVYHLSDMVRTSSKKEYIKHVNFTIAKVTFNLSNHITNPTIEIEHIAANCGNLNGVFSDYTIGSVQYIMIKHVCETLKK